MTITLPKGSGTPLALGSVDTDAAGAASGTFALPATPGGAEQAIRFASGAVTVNAAFEVAPRILAGGGEAGGPSSISLRGYAAGEVVQIRWRVGESWVPVGNVTTSSTGSANTTVTIPAAAAAGNNSVRGDGPEFRAQTNFAPVTTGPPAEEASASVSPSRAIVGTVIAYTVEDFPATATVTLTLQRPASSAIELGTVQTDATGAASGTFALPATPGGAGQAVRFVAGSETIDVPFEVAPRIKVTTGVAGEETGVSLRGFGAGEVIVIRWLVGSTWVEVGTATMSSTGSANINVTIPEDAAAGNNSVRADGFLFSAQTNFAVVTVPLPPV